MLPTAMADLSIRDTEETCQGRHAGSGLIANVNPHSGVSPRSAACEQQRWSGERGTGRGPGGPNTSGPVG